MSSVFCLTEQAGLPAWAILRANATVDLRSITDLAAGWDRPLVVSGDGLRDPAIAALIARAYRNPAPLLIMPPLPQGDMTRLLGADAPVEIVRQRSEQVVLADATLQQALGRDELHILCTEAIETALRAGELATAGGRPVVWAYQPTRGATPVLWIGIQLLLASARTDPVDREDLLAALLAWAEAHTKGEPAVLQPDAGRDAADRGLLRALVVAWSVRPDLSGDDLATWLRQRLAVDPGPAEHLAASVAGLAALGALDDAGRPDGKRLALLTAEWGLRAWVREARRMEATA